MAASFLKRVILFTCSIGTVLCHEGHHDEAAQSSKAEEIRNKINLGKWEASDLMDVEHMQAEINDLKILQEKGELTSEEVAFYFFRLHDFDINEKLDGIEISTGMRHSLGANGTEEVIEQAVDLTLALDTNNDGFVDYVELKSKLRENQKERQEASQHSPQK